MTADRRIAQWQATLDPGVLWPETATAQRLAGYEQILAATGNVLADRPARLDAGTESDGRAMGVAAFLSGMGPLLAWWIEQGRIAAAPRAAAVLAQHLAHSRRRLARTTERLRDVMTALARRGIVPTILKGTYTARRYFVDPATRTGSDADLLVRPDEFPAVAETLAALGLERHTRHTLPHREEWGPPGTGAVQSLELAHEANPWLVDVHQSLDRRYFPGLTAGLGIPDPSSLAPWPSPFGLARVLPQPLLAAHLALNAASDFPDGQLIRTVELVNAVRQDTRSGELRWSDLLDLLRRTGTARFAYPAFAHVEFLVPGIVDPALHRALEHVATPRMRRLVPQYARGLPLHSGRKSVDLHLVWAKGPRQVARKLFDLAYPTGPDISPRVRLRIWRRRLGLLVSGRVGWSRQG